MTTERPAAFVLTFSCVDAVGIVAAVTGLLAETDGFILDSQQYADLDSGRFFMRVEFRGAGPRFPQTLDAVRAAFAPIVARFGMEARISDAGAKPRFVIAVSQGSHCLNDLLHRWSTGNLAIDIVGVVSNHDHLRRLTEWHGVPFHYLPVSDANRAEQEAALAFANIEETLAEVGRDAPGTALHNDGSGELIGSAIAYDKGHFFMRTVERIVGRERFDAWLRQWFDNHAFEPATSALLLADMQENLVRSPAEAERLMLREWIFEPGLPSNVARPDPAAFAAVDSAVDTYASNGTIPAGWNGWTAAERMRFLDNIPKDRSAAQLAELDRQLNLSGTGNNEIRFLWLELALANRYEPAVPQAEEFLARVGRAKFVRPLFAVLMGEGEWGQPIARRIYAQTRDSYHAVTRAGVDRVLGIAG